MAMVLFSLARSAFKAAIYGYLAYEVLSRADQAVVEVLCFAPGAF